MTIMVFVIVIYTFSLLYEKKCFILECFINWNKVYIVYMWSMFPAFWYQNHLVHKALNLAGYNKTFWLVGKVKVLLTTLMMALFYSRVPVSHDSESTTKLKQLNGIQPWFMLLCTPVFVFFTTMTYKHVCCEDRRVKHIRVDKLTICAILYVLTVNKWHHCYAASLVYKKHLFTIWCE